MQINSYVRSKIIEFRIGSGSPKKPDISQTRLGEVALGLSGNAAQKRISEIETSKKSIRVDELCLIAKALNKNVFDFLNEEIIKPISGNPPQSAAGCPNCKKLEIEKEQSFNEKEDWKEVAKERGERIKKLEQANTNLDTKINELEAQIRETIQSTHDMVKNITNDLKSKNIDPDSIESLPAINE